MPSPQDHRDVLVSGAERELARSRFRPCYVPQTCVNDAVPKRARTVLIAVARDARFYSRVDRSAK
jgi:hypothetical protein